MRTTQHQPNGGSGPLERSRPPQPASQGCPKGIASSVHAHSTSRDNQSDSQLIGALDCPEKWELWIIAGNHLSAHEGWACAGICEKNESRFLSPRRQRFVRWSVALDALQTARCKSSLRA